MKKLPEEIHWGQGGRIEDTELAYRTINALVEVVNALIFCFCALALAVVVIALVVA